MTQGSAQTALPVLFLSDLVVLPGMVVPISLDEAAQAAVDAAQASSGGELLLAPRLEDRYASYGVIATVERVGRFSGGTPAAVLKAGSRGRIGSGVTGPGAALWVEVEPVDDVVSDHARELAEEYKRLVVAVLQRREAWQVIDQVHQMTDPSAIADAAGYAPYLSIESKRELLENPDVESRLETLIGWTRDHLAESELTDKIGEDVREGMEKTQREYLLRQQLAAIRKELGEGEPEGADDYRARVEAADLPDAVRAAALKEVDKLERASDQSPETVVDPDLARHRARAALDRHHRGLQRRRRRSRGARRRPPRPRRGQGADRGVPRGPVPSRRARPAGRRRTRLRRGRAPRRSSRSRQDLARRVGRPRARPQVRPRRPRRRPRRGRDPRSPADVRRRAARAASCGPSRRPAR